MLCTFVSVLAADTGDHTLMYSPLPARVSDKALPGVRVSVKVTAQRKLAASESLSESEN